MNLPKIRKGSPLLLLVLLTIGALAVGAGLFDLFTSGPTTGIYQIDTDVRGLQAQLMQAGVWTRYSSPIDSTTLEDQLFGIENVDIFADHAAILVVHDYELPTEDLTLTIRVFEAGTAGTETEIPYMGTWTCTATYVEFWYGTDAGIDPHTENGAIILTDTTNTMTILHAEIEDLVYDILTRGIDGSGTSIADGDWNALVLSFVFNGQTAMEYSATWSPESDYTTPVDVDVVVSLAVETS